VGGGDDIKCRYWRCSRQMLCFVGLLKFSHTRRSESGGWESGCGNHDDQTRFEISGLSGSVPRANRYKHMSATRLYAVTEIRHDIVAFSSTYGGLRNDARRYHPC
jgi:hypothetical protein